jgi:maleate isomerase
MTTITPRSSSDKVLDALGWRAKFGVLAPSTNTIVEPDFYAMSVPGVTSHMSRIHIRDQDMSDDAKMEALLQQIRDEIDLAVASVLTAEPDYLVMGMSAETFWGGVDGNKQFHDHLEKVSGLQVTTGAAACESALKAVGARRIGVVTPYQKVGDDNVVRFFTELGFDVVAIKGLRRPTAVSIAETSEDTLREAILEVNAPEVDAIIQAGTNLSMVRLADEAERWLGKPVLAINAVTWWHALRANGVEDKLYGFGNLLRHF